MRVMTLAGLKERIERSWKTLQEWFITMWININRYFNSLCRLAKHMWSKKWFRICCYIVLALLVMYLVWLMFMLTAQAGDDAQQTNLIYDRNGDGIARVTIDAGHGYNTAGKRTPDGVHEWTMNDAIADTVERVLESNGVEVIRLDDVTGATDVPLRTRSSMANQYNADVHLSIHNNAFGSGCEWGNWHGTEAFVKSPASEAHGLAEKILSNIEKNTGITNRGVKYNNLHMTREVRVPSVLVEGGFMDSVIDKPIIDDPWGQEAIGEGIAEAVLDWLSCGL